MRGVDAVYHVAGTFDTGPDGAERMRGVHVVAADTLCRGAKEAGIRRVVLCSSSVTIGFGPLSSPGDETTALDADAVYGTRGPLRAYYDTKMEAEQLARDWTSRGLEVVVVNPDYTLGAWDLKPTSGALIVQLAKHPMPIYPRGGKCFIDVDDAAIAHIRAMEVGVPGERYLLGSHNRSYREFLNTVAEIVGRRPPLFPISRRVTRVAAGFGTLLARRFPAQASGLDGRVLLAMQQERYRSGRRAIEELGMPTTPLETSIEKAYLWFQEHNYC